MHSARSPGRSREEADQDGALSRVEQAVARGVDRGTEPQGGLVVRLHLRLLLFAFPLLWACKQESHSVAKDDPHTEAGDDDDIAINQLDDELERVEAASGL